MSNKQTATVASPLAWYHEQQRWFRDREHLLISVSNSVQCPWGSWLLSRRKRVDFRMSAPTRFVANMPMFIYQIADYYQIVGIALVEVVAIDKSGVGRQAIVHHGATALVGDPEIAEHYRMFGTRPVGLFLAHATRFAHPLALADVRAWWPKDLKPFHPPQGYLYIPPAVGAALVRIGETGVWETLGEVMP